MLDTDSVTRSVLYPRGFVNGVLAGEAFLKLDEREDAPGVYEVSVGPKGRFQDEAAIHDFGCRVAVEANLRMSEFAMKAGRVHDPLCYMGYYTIGYGSLLTITTKLHHISVIWSPDKAANLEEHCDLVVRWNGYTSTHRERKHDRLAIQSSIAALLVGPVRGYCACDAARHAELKEIALPIGPITPPPIAAT